MLKLIVFKVNIKERQSDNNRGRSHVFIINVEKTQQVILVCLLLALNRYLLTRLISSEGKFRQS